MDEEYLCTKCRHCYDFFSSFCSITEQECPIVCTNCKNFVDESTPKTCGNCEWMELDTGECWCHKHRKQIDNHSFPTECPTKFICDDWKQSES